MTGRTILAGEGTGGGGAIAVRPSCASARMGGRREWRKAAHSGWPRAHSSRSTFSPRWDRRVNSSTTRASAGLTDPPGARPLDDASASNTAGTGREVGGDSSARPPYGIAGDSLDSRARELDLPGSGGVSMAERRVAASSIRLRITAASPASPSIAPWRERSVPGRRPCSGPSPGRSRRAPSGGNAA